jgi:hypothetical protein
MCTAGHAYVFKHKDLIFSSPPAVFSECVNRSGIIGEQTLVKRRERKREDAARTGKHPPFIVPTP